MTNYSCHVGSCKDHFHTKKELKNHLITVHRKMRVICVLCTNNNNPCFSRVGEWKRHCEGKHRDELAQLGPEFCTEKNAAWLAVNPESYSRIITVANWSDDISVTTRKAALKWTESVSEPIKTLDDWMEGWESMKNKDDHDDDILSLFAESTCSNESYDPAHPAFTADEAFELIDGSIRRDSAEVMFRTPGGHLIYEARLSHLDERAVGSLSRKMLVLRSLKEGQRPSGEGVPLQGKEFTSRALTISSALAIDVNFVTAIRLWKPKYPTSQRKRPSTTSQPISSRGGDTSTNAKQLFILRTPSKPESLSSRSRKILSKGCMSLLPPARRDWGTKQVVLKVGSIVSIWPPTDWDKMDGDQRLLQWDFAAMTVEQELQGRTPVIDRQLLRDKYNMLALPGSPAAPLQNSPMAKARVYNYFSLVDIALGKSTSPESESFYKIIAGAMDHRCTDTDDIITALEDAKIPMRLEAPVSE